MLQQDVNFLILVCPGLLMVQMKYMATKMKFLFWAASRRTQAGRYLTSGTVMASRSNNLLYIQKKGTFFCEVFYESTSYVSDTVVVIENQREFERVSGPSRSCSAQQLTNAFSEETYIFPSQELVYNDEDLIGSGSYAKVYKGELRGTTVAIKKIRIKREASTKRIVEQEMVIHSHLKHPNIVTFLGASFGKGALYIVTEYIHGANLEDVIFDVNEREKYPALSTSRKHNIATNISQAIGYLHGNNPCVLHCDIKPANILVSQSFDVVKLCDLGISKV